jgi:urate oxidase
MSVESRIHYIVGETWGFDIGVATIEQRYDSISSMHYRIASGPRTGTEETVAIDVQLIRPGVFLVSWQEADVTTVVHVEDFDHNTFYSHATRPGGEFYRVHGKMWRLR